MVLLASPAKLPARLLYAGRTGRSNLSRNFSCSRRACQPGRNPWRV